MTLNTLLIFFKDKTFFYFVEKIEFSKLYTKISISKEALHKIIVAENRTGQTMNKNYFII